MAGGCGWASVCNIDKTKSKSIERYLQQQQDAGPLNPSLFLRCVVIRWAVIQSSHTHTLSHSLIPKGTPLSSPRRAAAIHLFLLVHPYHFLLVTGRSKKGSALPTTPSPRPTDNPPTPALSLSQCKFSFMRKKREAEGNGGLPQNKNHNSQKIGWYTLPRIAADMIR